MRLERQVCRLIPEVLKRPFPFKAESLEQFAGLVVETGGIYVEARLDRKAPRTSSGTVGSFGIFVYEVVLNSETRSGRKIIFRSFLLNAFHSEFGISDRNTREELTFRCFVTADAMLSAIKERVPAYTRVDLIGGNGAVLQQNELEVIRAEARRRRIEPLSI